MRRRLTIVLLAVVATVVIGLISLSRESAPFRFLEGHQHRSESYYDDFGGHEIRSYQVREPWAPLYERVDKEMMERRFMRGETFRPADSYEALDGVTWQSNDPAAWFVVLQRDSTFAGAPLALAGALKPQYKNGEHSVLLIRMFRPNWLQRTWHRVRSFVSGGPRSDPTIP